VTIASPPDDATTTGGAEGKRVRSFDFRRPNKLSRDHVRNLLIVHETFARQVTTLLSSTMRAVSSVSVRSIDQVTYDEYVRHTPNPSHLSVLAVAPLPGVALLQLPVRFVLTAVDLMLGGHGRHAPPDRPLTEIETALIRTVIDRALHELTYAFEAVMKLEPSVVLHESNPQFAQIAAPTDMMVAVRLKLMIEGVEADGAICYPYALLQPVLDAFEAHTGHHDRLHAEVEKDRAQVAARLHDVPVEMRVVFPPVMLSSNDIVELRIGDVVPLGRAVEAPMWGMIENLRVLDVRPGRRSKRLAAEVVDVPAPFPTPSFRSGE
jgi:flagellar motor switch protein FliM